MAFDYLLFHHLNFIQQYFNAKLGERGWLVVKVTLAFNTYYTMSTIISLKVKAPVKKKNLKYSIWHNHLYYSHQNSLISQLNFRHQIG